MFSIWTILILLQFTTRVVAQDTVWTPFVPVSVPLAVRSPYLNAWLPQGNEPHPISNSWPHHWPSLEHVTMLGWDGILVVDNDPYWIMGIGETSNVTKFANLTAVSFTPSITSFNLTAGPVDVRLQCLSPIETNDFTRLSIPFSYISISVVSTDGKPHDARIGMAIAADLISGNHSFAANASSIIDDDIVALQMELQTPLPFVEVDDFPEDAAAYIATANGVGVSYQVSNNSDGFPGTMASLTVLPNTVDPNYSSHALDLPFDSFGILVDMGSFVNTSPTVVFTIGVVRDPSIKYSSLSGQDQLRYPYFKANFSTPSALISFVLNDFNRSLDAAQAFDSNLVNAATNISSTYASLISLTTRQALSALDITISQASDGSLNASDVKAFMKDMGGMGSRGVNAVSVLYAALPMYLYLAPNLLGRLLEPLLEANDDPSYTLPYPAQHLGVGYPNATAQNEAHNFGVEESGNMLILSLAHAQETTDYSLISKFYNLLSGWAKYLVANALSPDTQQTSPFDGIFATNQTNLSLKGIIGIAAMGAISSLLGQTQDAATFNSTANSYIQQWLSLSRSADGSRILTAFGDETSTGLLYNLFADKILRLNLVAEGVYQNQTALYRSMQDNGSKGVPLSTSNLTLSRTDWTMFAAATSTDSSTRDAFVSWVHQVASTTTNSTPLGVLFNPTSNIITGGTNSPAHGSMYAVLALSGNTLDNTDNTTGQGSGLPPSHRKKKSLAPIVGGIIGGAVALILCVVVFLKSRKRKLSKNLHSTSPYYNPSSLRDQSPPGLIARFRGYDKPAGSRGAVLVPATDVLRKGEAAVPAALEELATNNSGSNHAGTSSTDDALFATSEISGRDRRVNETMVEMEMRALRAQVLRLMEQSGRASFGIHSESENPPSYESRYEA